MKCFVFTGTRELLAKPSLLLIERRIEMLPYVAQDGDKVLVGDCPTGVDYAVREACHKHKIRFEEFKAHWDKFGKAAGPLRNGDMLAKYAGYVSWVFAFPWVGTKPFTGGTWNCIEQAINDFSFSITIRPVMSISDWEKLKRAKDGT